MLEKGMFIRFKPGGKFISSVYGVEGQVIEATHKEGEQYSIHVKVTNGNGTWHGGNAIGTVHLNDIEIITTNKDYAMFLKK